MFSLFLALLSVNHVLCVVNPTDVDAHAPPTNTAPTAPLLSSLPPELNLPSFLSTPDLLRSLASVDRSQSQDTRSFLHSDGRRDEEAAALISKYQNLLRTRAVLEDRGVLAAVVTKKLDLWDLDSLKACSTRTSGVAKAECKQRAKELDEDLVEFVDAHLPRVARLWTQAALPGAARNEFLAHYHLERGKVELERRDEIFRSAFDDLMVIYERFIEVARQAAYVGNKEIILKIVRAFFRGMLKVFEAAPVSLMGLSPEIVNQTMSGHIPLNIIVGGLTELAMIWLSSRWLVRLQSGGDDAILITVDPITVAARNENPVVLALIEVGYMSSGLLYWISANTFDMNSSAFEERHPGLLRQFGPELSEQINNLSLWSLLSSRVLFNVAAPSRNEWCGPSRLNVTAWYGSLDVPLKRAFESQIASGVLVALAKRTEAEINNFSIRSGAQLSPADGNNSSVVLGVLTAALENMGIILGYIFEVQHPFPPPFQRGTSCGWTSPIGCIFPY
jgi:hypothetical protein